MPRLRMLPLLGALLLVAGLAFAARPSKRMSDDERGELLYNRHCAQCHGATAAGNGPATEALVAPVPDLRGKLTGEAREANAALVLDGRGPMPGFAASFDRYDARRVLRFMEKVSPATAGEHAQPLDPAEVDAAEDHDPLDDEDGEPGARAGDE